MITAAGLLLGSIPAVFADRLIDVALSKTASASSELSADFSAQMANDGLNENESYTSWICADDDKKAWWQVDLNLPYKIASVAIEPRKNDGLPENRRSFRVLGSNDETFSEYSVLAEQDETEFSGDVWEAKVSEQTLFRYIRAEKTAEEGFAIGEMHVYASDEKIDYGFDSKNSAAFFDDETDEQAYKIPADIAGTDLEPIISVLRPLRLMRGYEDGTFCPENNVSRAEFAAVCARLRGVAANISDGASDFSDVPSDHWAYGYIMAMKGIGAVNGRGGNTFEPEGKVTYGEAVKMLVNILGYGAVAENYGGYPGGYFRAAQPLGLLFDGKAADAPMTRADIARILYKAINADVLTQTVYGNRSEGIVEQGTTILAKSHNIYRYRGIFTGCTLSCITDELLNLAPGNVQIDGKIFLCDVPGAERFLGMYVEYYVKEQPDGEEKIVAVTAHRKNIVTTVTAEDIFDFSGNTFRYETESGGEDRVYISKTADIVYNGKALRNYSDKDLIPEEGYLTFIDNNNDGEAEVLLVHARKNGVVNYVNLTEETVYFKNGAGKLSFSAQNDDVVFTSAQSGERLSLSDLTEWNVLTYEQSKSAGRQVIRVLVSDKSVRGVVSQIDDDGAVIDGVQYKFSPYMNKSLLKTGDTVIVYLDAADKIAALDTENTFSVKYGYCTKMNKDKGIDNDVSVKIFTSAGDFRVYPLGKKTVIDGTEYSDYEGMYRYLLNGDDEFTPQLVKYKLTSGGKIKMLDTARQGTGSGDDSLELTVNASFMTYIIGGVFGGQYTLNDTSVVFNVPTDVSDEGGYSIGSAGQFQSTKQYTFKGYDGAKDRMIRAMVLDGGGKAPDRDTPVFALNSISREVDKSENIVYKLTGFSEEKEVSYTESRTGIVEAAGIRIGDILRFTLDASNRITKIEKDFSMTPCDDKTVITPRNVQLDTLFSAETRGYGTVAQRTGSKILIKIESAAEPTILVETAGTRIHVWNGQKKEFRAGSINDITDAETAGDTDASKIFYIGGGGLIVDLVVFE